MKNSGVTQLYPPRVAPVKAKQSPGQNALCDRGQSYIDQNWAADNYS